MRKMAVLVGLLIVALLLVACGDEPPPTQIVVVTATPLPTAVVSPETDSPANTPEAATSPSPTISPEPSDTPVTPTDTVEPRDTDTPTQTPTPPDPLMPTNVYAQVQLAEQVFERGRMMWLRHNRQIWVMIQSEDDPSRGDWFCYNDTYEEGEPEIDPALIPPESLVQPRRGFGKLWRTLPDIREGMGWATTTEFELTSSYTYIAGGQPDEDGNLPPGEHRLTTLYNETIIFYEQEMRGDCTGGLWRMSQ